MFVAQDVSVALFVEIARLLRAFHTRNDLTTKRELTNVRDVNARPQCQTMCNLKKKDLRDWVPSTRAIVFRSHLYVTNGPLL